MMSANDQFAILNNFLPDNVLSTLINKKRAADIEKMFLKCPTYNHEIHITNRLLIIKCHVIDKQIFFLNSLST